MLDLEDVRVHYKGRGRDRRSLLRAVDGVSLRISSGESFGLVGESGCGKSSLARVVAGLQPAESGTIRLEGVPLPDRRTRDQLRRIQMVFQDPATSLDPRMSIRETVSEVLAIGCRPSRRAVEERCAELMASVGLQTSLLDRHPGRLSGGQRQRVSIARALAVEPDVLVADEAVAALDVSVQAGILNLLVDLRDRMGLTTLFISHDLSVVRHLCDRVGVMYLGRLVEVAETEQLFSSPAHPYTRALLAAVPRFGQPPRIDELMNGDGPSARRLPAGCRFHPRCPHADARCRSEEPQTVSVGTGHLAACHLATEDGR